MLLVEAWLHLLLDLKLVLSSEKCWDRKGDSIITALIKIVVIFIVTQSRPFNEVQVCDRTVLTPVSLTGRHIAYGLLRNSVHVSKLTSQKNLFGLWHS
jgi:hypothetical protein